MRSIPATTLALRDVQLPPAPGWWPLAPGWWIVIAVVLLLLAWLLGRRLHRAWRRRRLAADFDQRLQGVASPLDELALMAELLRRAALVVDPATARLQGEDWLVWLDGGRDRGFVRGAGRLLLDGAYRPSVAADQVASLRPLARAAWARLRLEAKR